MTSAIAAFLAPQAAACKVWLGTHKWEGVAADNLNQWDQAIAKIEGINYVLLDARADRPNGEGANTNDWRTMIAPIDQSIPGMAEIARSQFQPAHGRTLAERMVNEFATARNNGGYEIDIIMLHDDATADGTVHKYNLADVQAVRVWLDNKFVFLRLSKDAPVGTSTRKYITTSANGASAANDPTNWPKIQFTAVEGNHVPTLNAINDCTLIAGQTLQIAAQATDSDTPAQNLTFSLISPPGGASIHPATGAFTWRPTIAQSPSSHTLTIRVADNGTPDLSATRSFLMTVQKPATPILTVNRSTNGIANLSLTGDPGPDYEVEASGNLRNWQPLWSNGSTVPPCQFNDPEAANHDKRFYRVGMGP